MKPGDIIVFPKSILRNKNLTDIPLTPLRVNYKEGLGVRQEDFNDVCDILNLDKNKLSMIPTDYQGVFLVQLPRRRTKAEAKAEHALMRNEYMKLCGSSRRAEDLNNLNRKQTDLSTQIGCYQESLVVCIRQLEENKRQVEIIQKIDESSFDRFGDEFDQLMKHPDIRKIEIEREYLLAFTKLIFIQYAGEKYEIGEFEISINTHGREGGVKMTNLTRNIDETDHPHVTRGVPCLGNIKEIIPQMIGEYKYAAVISVCIQYLKSYNDRESHQPYSYIDRWPKVKKPLVQQTLKIDKEKKDGEIINTTRDKTNDSINDDD